MKKVSLSEIEACIAGDKISQKKVFEQFYNTLFRVCFRYTNNIPDAEDCLMTGYVKAFKNIHSFNWDNDNSFYWWIKKIMVNESLMHLRSRQNFSMFVEEDLSVVDVEIPASVYSSFEAEELAEMIGRLPAGYRTVFNLFVVEGYSHQEIGEVLKISPVTSRTQLAKARLKLQDLMKRNINYGKTGR